MGLGVINKLIVANRMPKPFAHYPLVSDGRDIIGGRDMQLENVIFEQNGAYFNGVNSKGTIPDDDVFTFADTYGDKPFSISFYTKIEKSGCYYVLKTKNANTREFEINSYGSRQIRAIIYSNGGRYKWIRFRSQDNIPLNQMVHIVVTYDGSQSENGIKAYLNKVEVQGNKDSSQPYQGIANTDSPVYVGKMPFGNYTMKGYLKDIKFFDVELTPEQIQML